MGYFSLSGTSLGDSDASTAPFRSVQHEIADLNVLPEDTEDKSCGQEPGVSVLLAAGPIYVQPNAVSPHLVRSDSGLQPRRAYKSHPPVMSH